MTLKDFPSYWPCTMKHLIVSQIWCIVWVYTSAVCLWYIDGIMQSRSNPSLSAHGIDHLRQKGLCLLQERISTTHANLTWKKNRKCKYIFIFAKINSIFRGLREASNYEPVMDVVTVLFLDSLLLWVTSLSPTRGTHVMLHYRAIDSCANFPGQTLQRPSNCCCWPTRYCFPCIQ